MSEEFHRKYRPKSLKAVQGQTKAVTMLRRLADSEKIPHQMLFTGPSGCGKTTLGRIVADTILDCHGKDFIEINAASSRGVDMVRDIQRIINSKPLFGRTRVWFIDEAHKLTGDAQNAFLKILEEPPGHAYIFLASTEPNKIIKTIQTRCTEVRLDLLKPDEIEATVSRVAKKESISLNQDAMAKIVDASEGSARKALVILQSLVGIEDDDEKLLAIDRASSKSEAYKIGVELIYGQSSWAKVASIINTMEDDNYEGIRMLILAMASNALLDPKKIRFHAKAYKTIVCFSDPFYNTGKSGLVASCYEATRSPTTR
jgi:DNA polymerase III gamma/tau subunit